MSAAQSIRTMSDAALHASLDNAADPEKLFWLRAERDRRKRNRRARK